MFQRFLYKEYGIQAEEQLKLDSHDIVRGNGRVYMLEKVSRFDEEDLLELQQLADYMRNFGDQNIPVMIPSKEGKLLTSWEGSQYCLLAFNNIKKKGILKLGRKLAKFHERGKMVPYQVQRSSRIGQWKELWEKRLEQMEGVWNGRIFQSPEDEFERMFIESFPYYLALTENAIQYLVDAEFDHDPTQVDHGTVCHERLSATSWGMDYLIKNPLHWVFDHRSRDLAEWTRERYFLNNQTYQRDVKMFYQDYVRVAPLSAFSWKLLFARILFPLHYFACIENYYITRSEQEKHFLTEQLSKILRQSSDYERFLSSFYQLAGAPVKTLNISQPEWLY